MKKNLLLILVSLFLLTSCGPGGLRIKTPTSTSAGTPATFTPPPATPTPTSPGVQESPGQKVVMVSFRVAGDARVRPEVDAGSGVTLQLSFEPAMLSRLTNPSGTPVGTSSKPWPDAQIAGMQVCWALDNPCELDGRWQTYLPLQKFDLVVDWLGPRTLWAAARFKGPGGEDIPSVKPYEFSFSPVTRTNLELAGRLNSQTPLARLPARVQTAAAATRQTFPVSGAVVIENGRCCAGGTAGSSIQLKVEFTAASTSGEVTEMRIRQGMGCQKDAATLDAPWEKFALTRTFTTTLALNWVGWYINVQYRDRLGNLSPIYCDDISLEGSPPR